MSARTGSVRRFSAAPIRFASGVQNKVLEAMLAMGVPVVTCGVVAEGLKTCNAIPALIIANTVDQIADRVNELLGNSCYRDQLAGDAHTCGEQNFCWSKLLSNLQTYCTEVAEAYGAIGPEKAA